MKNSMATFVLCLLALAKISGACSCFINPLKLDTLSRGVVELSRYIYPDPYNPDTSTWAIQIQDTVYEADLKQGLQTAVNSHSYVFIGEITEVSNLEWQFFIEETTQDSTVVPVGYNQEVKVSVHQNYKGISSANIILPFYNKVTSISSCDVGGYETALNLKFFSFSNNLDSAVDLQIKRAFACDPASGYLVENGRITHRDFPGVSVALSDLELPEPQSLRLQQPSQNTNMAGRFLQSYQGVFFLEGLAMDKNLRVYDARGKVKALPGL